MPEAHEQLEHAEHAQHAAHDNKKIALIIAVLALMLSFSEMLGKGAQTEAISLNIKSSDTWNFFQAKTIRQTAIRTAAEGAVVQLPLATNTDVKDGISKQIDRWNATVARYESDPKEKDGRKELRAAAEELEHERDTMLAKYHNYEIASAAFQIGIVLCSAAVITGIVLLAWFAAGIAVLGAAFMAIGLFAPHLAHLA
jgi:ABC-type nickel/cobalt efflux system permease component RcnA